MAFKLCNSVEIEPEAAVLNALHPTDDKVDVRTLFNVFMRRFRRESNKELPPDIVILSILAFNVHDATDNDEGGVE